MGVREFAPAKVNLALHVTGRRADGYHELDSLVVFASIGDELTAEPADALSLTIAGPKAAGLPQDDNLVLKAARSLIGASGRSGLGAALTLDKQLPSAAGIGGGSADAAAALRALNRMWGLKLDTAALAGLGARLGADVPVCVHAKSARMRGIGEIVEPVSLPQASLVLVNPGVNVATAEVFASLQRRDGSGLPVPAGRLDSVPQLAGYLALCRNDLEAPAILVAPSIVTVLDALRASDGCLLARMSGSGATCFGLFENPAAAEAAAEVMSARHPAWWVTACRTIG